MPYLSEAVILSTYPPIPVQWTRRRRCRDAYSDGAMQQSHGWSVEASVSVGWGAEELIQSGQRFVSGEATVTVGGHGEYSSSKSSTNEATTEVSRTPKLHVAITI